MKTKDQLLELESKIAEGLENAYLRMVAMKRFKKSPIVISKGNKIIELSPDTYEFLQSNLSALREKKVKYKTK